MVRYSDGPEAQRSVEIAASPEAVWALVSDPGFPVEHSKELQEASWDPEGPGPGLGARILGRNQNSAIGEWETSSTVVVWDQPEAFSWVVGEVEDPSSQWWFELEPSKGGTVLRQRVRLGPALSGLSIVISQSPEMEEEIIDRRLRFLARNIEANLDAAKLTLEAKS